MDGIIKVNCGNKTDLAQYRPGGFICPKCKVSSRNGFLGKWVWLCPTCNGVQASSSSDGIIKSKTCSSCGYQNSPYYYGHLCGKCEGNGRVSGCEHGNEELHLYCNHNYNGYKH